MADQTYNLIDLATQQLNVAISLFLKRRSFVSALTLAGAADEILGKTLSHSGQQNSLELKYETMEPILTMQHQTKEDFIRDENHALIAVTHMESASDSSVTLDLEEAAYSVIVRACHNHYLLGLPRTAKIREFENWFDEHVTGVESENAFYGSENAFYADLVGVEFP
jgi:hypothetical protein